ncbi:nucleotidyl transferase AbiEii/AbiGii toxin family protein [Candidatus Shapirobacteria bacterium]|nr:nucleotidyl transferase AbiEii/AbiGii toxin family protein [Candidatus Shapirobacteria bacterium]
MITVRPEDAIHKAYLFRVLTEIIDNPLLSQSLYFKGGTCASLMGILDRFSIDLDFDQKPGVSEARLRTEFHQLFKKNDLTISQESQKTLEFFVKYQNTANQRNTLKIDALNFQVKSNRYAPFFLAEINRTINCQTSETIFANKLVAVTDRYILHQSIAGRDLYDIHHFFMNNLRYLPEIIIERTSLSPKKYFEKLIKFINSKITQTLIDQDLNTLLPTDKFKTIRRHLKSETIMFLQNELARH